MSIADTLIKQVLSDVQFQRRGVSLYVDEVPDDGLIPPDIFGDAPDLSDRLPLPRQRADLRRYGIQFCDLGGRPCAGCEPGVG